jgi:hypothetical protein
VKLYLRFGLGLAVGLALGLVLMIPLWLVTFEVSLKARRLGLGLRSGLG